MFTCSDLSSCYSARRTSKLSNMATLPSSKVGAQIFSIAILQRLRTAALALCGVRLYRGKRLLVSSNEIFYDFLESSQMMDIKIFPRSEKNHLNVLKHHDRLVCFTAPTDCLDKRHAMTVIQCITIVGGFKKNMRKSN